MFVCLLWFGVFAGRATERYVVPPGSAGITSGIPYNAWTNAATNIQSAVDEAALDETVWVTNGPYCITNQITITNRIILQSMNGYSNTLVYADWPTYTTRCFYVTHTGVVNGFSISNGYLAGSNDYGGGGGAYVATNGIIQNCYFIRNVNSNAGYNAGGGGAYADRYGVISNCLFMANRCSIWGGQSSLSGAGRGGGICMRDGRIFNCTIISNSSYWYGGGVYSCGTDDIISNCFIASNSTASGGGVFLFVGAHVMDSVISNNSCDYAGGGGNGGSYLNCVIINNRGREGAGIYMNESATLSNCVITGNRNTGASLGGGGVFMGSENRSHVVSGCRISNNVCIGVGGGGISVTNRGKVINCLICNNSNTSASGNGGGVLLGNAAKDTNKPYGLINCTIVNNYSANEGGGIATLGPSNYIVNCVIVGNNSAFGSYPDVYNTEANSNNYFYSCATSVLFAPNQGNITNDSVFVDPGASNWRLSSSSPCMNTGTNQNWMTNSVDLDGRMRIHYGTVDMGAYETIYNGTMYTVR